MGCCTSTESDDEKKKLLKEEPGLIKEDPLTPRDDITQLGTEHQQVGPAVDISNKKRAVALWDNPGDEEKELLQFKAGDEIIVLEEEGEEGWWWGLLDDKQGYFPINYTKIMLAPSSEDASY